MAGLGDENVVQKKKFGAGLYGTDKMVRGFECRKRWDLAGLV